MRKLLLSTVAFAALAIAPAYAQSTTGTMLSGTGVTCTPSTAASTTGTTTDTTASTSGTTGSGTSTDTTASTTDTTGSGTSTDTTASTSGTTGSGTSTDTTASTTDTTGSGTSTDTTASTGGTTTGTSTDTAASTSGTTTGAGTSSSTMALSANNQIDATVARTALTNAQTNVDRLSSISTAPSTVCLVDLDTLAQSDETLKGDISKFETNNAQIKSALEANTALMSNIKTNHPTFDVSKVRGVDIGPNNELVLYVVSGT